MVKRQHVKIQSKKIVMLKRTNEINGNSSYYYRGCGGVIALSTTFNNSGLYNML